MGRADREHGDIFGKSEGGSDFCKFWRKNLEMMITDIFQRYVEYLRQWFCWCLLIQFVGLFWYYADLRWWGTLCWFAGSGRPQPGPAKSSTTNQCFAPIYEFTNTDTKQTQSKWQNKTITFVCVVYSLACLSSFTLYRDLVLVRKMRVQTKFCQCHCLVCLVFSYL